MKLITRYEYAQSAPARWIAIYKNGRIGHSWTEVTAKMEAMTKPVDPDEIDALIGNDSWTHISSCSECRSQADPILEIGEKPDYESSTAYLCLPCFRKVAELVGKHAP